MPKLVKLVKSSSTLLAEELAPFITPSAAEAPFVRLRVCRFLCLPPWRDVAAELYAQGLLNADLCMVILIFAVNSSDCLSNLSSRSVVIRHRSAIGG